TSHRAMLGNASDGFSIPSTNGTSSRSAPLRAARVYSCCAHTWCSATWSPNGVSGPNATCSIPISSKYSKCCMNDSVERVRLLFRERRVRRGLHADDATPLGACAQHFVGFHTPGVPQCPRPGVGDEDWLRARGDGVQRRLVVRV